LWGPVVLARPRISGTARAQELKAEKERAISNLGSTPSKILLFAVGLRY